MSPDDKQLAAHMLRELESPSKELTSWELGFLESVGDQLETRGSMTDKQMEILKRIYEEKTA